MSKEKLEKEKQEPKFVPTISPPEPQEPEPQDIEHGGVLQTLHELVERSVPLDDPLVGMLLSEPDLVSFAFWADEPAFVDSARALLRGEQTYDKIIRDGFWNRALTWFGEFDVESEHESAFGQRLPIAEIHVPHVAGCVGTFAATRKGVLDVSIKAFGLGYQRVKRITLKDSYELPAGCGALTTGVQFVVHVWKHKFSEKRRALIHVVSIDGTLIDKPLGPSKMHRCGRRYRQVANYVESVAKIRGYKVGIDYAPLPMHDSTAGASTIHKMTLEEGVVYSASAGLSASWFSQPGTESSQISKLAISLESRVAKTVEMTWRLVSGHDYMGFRGVRGDMRMFWAWK